MQLEEAMAMIGPGATVSFGGGSTVAALAERLDREDPGLKETLAVTTPSMDTLKVLERLHYRVVQLDDVAGIDVAFDGCDFVTKGLAAQKCKGGIHVDEMKAARKAFRYVLLTKPERVGAEYNAELPVCAEVVPQEVADFSRKAGECGFAVEKRIGVETSRGNFLFDLVNDGCTAELAREVEDWPGVAGTSYFHDVCTDVIYEEDGRTIHLRREDAR